MGRTKETRQERKTKEKRKKCGEEETEGQIERKIMG